MELDDLKQTWQRSNEHIQRGSRDILDIIQNSSDSPVARLKHRFRKGMFLLPLIAAFTISRLIRKPDLLHIVVATYVGVFCLMMMIYFIISYRQMDMLQKINDNVRSILQRQVRLLRNGLKWRRLITRGMTLLYIVILETLMYFKPDPVFNKWLSQPITLRLAAYAGLFLIIYLITKYALNHRYRRHIKRLEELVEELGPETPGP